MRDLLQDLRFALRALRRSPGFTAVAVLSLGLGIGASAAILRLADTVLLRPWPVPRPVELVSLHLHSRSGPGFVPLSYPAFRDYRDAGILKALAAFASVPLGLNTGDRAVLVTGELASPGYFEALEIHPLQGRFFAPGEEAAPVAVLSSGLWNRLYGKDPGTESRELKLNGHVFTVVGVAPRGFQGIDLSEPADLWIPLETLPLVARGIFAQLDLLRGRGIRWLSTVGRLREGQLLDTARKALESVENRLAAAYPASDAGLRPFLASATKAATGLESHGEVSGFIGLLLIIVGLELAIACANVAGLLVARSTSRYRETSLRMALGASRWRCIRQLVTEGILLSFAGCLLSIVVARVGMNLLALFELPADIAIDTLGLGLDWRLIGFAMVLALAAGVAFSVPAALEVSAANLTNALKDHPLEPRPGRRRWLRNALVAVQVALTFLLIASTGLFIRSLRHSLSLDPGFKSDKMLSLTVDLGLQGYDTHQARRFYEDLATRVAVLPGIETAAWSRNLPLSSGGVSSDVYVEGYEAGPDEELQIALEVVSPGYFRTLDIPLLRGRPFDRADRDGAAGTVIINQAMARKFWPGREPIGQRLSTSGAQGPFLEVVGVVPDGKYRSLQEEGRPFFYVPLDQYFSLAGLSRMTFLVRTSRDPATEAQAVGREVHRLDADLPVAGLAPLREHIAGLLKTQRMGATLLGFFGSVALVLSLAGIYGVVAYYVGQRQRELALRMALGAQRSQVLAIVLGRSLTLVIAGLVAGFAAVVATGRVVAGFIYGVSASDPMIIIGSAALLVLSALAASLPPAWRASRLAPAILLRFQ